MTLEKFHYPTPKGELVLPTYGQIPFGVIRKTRHMDEADQMFAMFEELLDEKGLERLDSLGVEDVKDLAEKWQADSRVSLGESEAS